MADLLQDGVEWLGGELRAHASQPITYVRSTNSVAIDATIGKTDWPAETVAGKVTTAYQTRDFIFAAADLVLDALQVAPAAGDTITETIGPNTYTYTVVTPAGQKCYRYLGPDRTTLRVHTKLTATT